MLKMPQVFISRTIHPVGQGAFYTEEFYNAKEKHLYTFVYDCGSETATKNMEVPLTVQISDFKRNLENQVIDLLFISHFHEDHINGLDELLKNTHVHRTVIPMLPNEVVILNRVRNLMRYGDEARETDGIIRELYYGQMDGENSRFGKIIAVSPEQTGLEGEDTSSINSGEWFPQKGQVLRSGDSLTEPSIFWKYIPFNSIAASDQRAKDFVQQIALIPGVFNSKGELDVDEIVRNKRDDLKKVYENVMKGGNDNLYTLLVESTPEDGIKVEPCPQCARCLYTGDFEPEADKNVWKRFTGLYQNYPEIGTIQVPHHGSKHNWKQALLNAAGCRHYFISAGKTNRYHHPSYWVVRDIQQAGYEVSVACEELSSKMQCDYWIL